MTTPTQTKKQKVIKAPKTRPPERPIWLVWQEGKGPFGPMVDLRAVEECKEHAEILKWSIVNHEDVKEEDVWIEERIANHCYGFRDTLLAMRYYRGRQS